MAEDTMKLVLIRHGESEWNKLNLFTGWTDVELSETGEKEAAAGGRALNIFLGQTLTQSSQLLQRSSLKITFFKKINSFVGFSLYFPWS